MRNSEWGTLDSVSGRMILPMSADTAQSLLALNNSANTNDTITLLQKQVSGITLSNAAAGTSAYTTAQQNRLHHIAKLCPYIYGTSVYQARAILAGIEPLITEYWSDCEIPHDPEDNNQRTMKNFEKPFAGRLYPNPNDGKMQLDYELSEDTDLLIYDITGKQIFRYRLKASEKLIPVEMNLNEGIYLYKIISNNILLKTDKMVIIK